MSAALLLVDFQEDFLARPSLEPARGPLVTAAARLLAGCRQRGVPVLHVHTLIRPDGADRMPHWVRAGRLDCVAGTPGALPPAALAPGGGEAVFPKQFFSAFTHPGLAPRLKEAGTRTVVLAGLYLHACIRATAVDAYQLGFQVQVAADAVGSTEPVHGQLSREWLADRVAEFADTATLLRRLDAHPSLGMAS